MIRPRYSRCRSCDAEIIWGVTATGKRVPVDAEPVPEGNLELADDWDGTIKITYVRDERPGEERYTSHFATCPDGKEWRARP